ncbi:MAG: hypothetical protein IKN50_06820, partial [Clostridia bacterium]|nr:hypothetical protein [Clostridia bacterium]
TDAAKNAYLLGTLFPARASKPATALFRGLGFSGADGAIDVTEVVPEGKGRMDAASFVRGRGVFAGDVLGAK